jgi:hypothetical protein
MRRGLFIHRYLDYLSEQGKAGEQGADKQDIFRFHGRSVSLLGFCLRVNCFLIN